MVWWLVAAASGAEAFGTVQWVFGSFLGILFLMGITAAAWFHTLAGIRHLAWDAGWGYDIPTVYKSGRAVLVGTSVLTALTWLMLLLSWKGPERCRKRPLIRPSFAARSAASVAWAPPGRARITGGCSA